MHALNPKTALFFLAFRPQCVDPGRGAVGAQVAAPGTPFVLLGLCTDGAHALTAGTAGAWLRARPALPAAERRIAGLAFLGLGTAAPLAGSHRK